MVTFDLITDLAYYNSRRRLLYFGMFIPIALGILVDLIWEPHLFLTIILLIILIVFLTLQLKVTRHINRVTKQQKIVLSEDKINIVGKDLQVLDEFALGNPYKVFVDSSFEISQETGADVIKEMIGKGTMHKIALYAGNEKHTFDFVIDSHYKIVQFKKVIDRWKTDGFLVEILP